MLVNKDKGVNYLQNVKSRREKENLPTTPRKGIYIFVSFDLVNSTKIKYRDENWLRIIKEFIKISKKDWLGLTFWKYNGDEVLYYAELNSLTQIVHILEGLHKKTISFKNELLQVISNDAKASFTKDLIGIKAAVWIAYVTNEDSPFNFNSRLEDIDSIDFAGINMDEGFRMSKFAIQDEVIVDPKIALLICLVAHELKENIIGKLSDDEKESFKLLVSPDGLEQVFRKFWLNNEYESLPPDCSSTFINVADNFRIIGYETCKGVWDERPYPIIWYSNNWSDTINAIKYDEVYNNQRVDEKLISGNYNSAEFKYLFTKNELAKIYADVSVFRSVVNNILLECNFKLWSDATLDMHFDMRTYLYYSVVYILKKTNAALVFLRSPARGHLPNVWDFDQQKNAQTLLSRFSVVQIQERFKNSFDIDIQVVQNKFKKSIIPMDIHPIYRRGAIHTGILCYAYLDDKYSEKEILNNVRSKLCNLKSRLGYQLYSDVTFVHLDQLNVDAEKATLQIDNKEIEEMTYDELLQDSNSCGNPNKDKQLHNKCTPYFILTLQEAINYSKKHGGD